MHKIAYSFLSIEDYGYSKSRTKIGVSVDITACKKTKSSRAENVVFGIDKTSNQNIKEGGKKASRYEKFSTSLDKEVTRLKTTNGIVIRWGFFLSNEFCFI